MSGQLAIILIRNFTSPTSTSRCACPTSSTTLSIQRCTSNRRSSSSLRGRHSRQSRRRSGTCSFGSRCRSTSPRTTDIWCRTRNRISRQSLVNIDQDSWINCLLFCQYSPLPSSLPSKYLGTHRIRPRQRNRRRIRRPRSPRNPNLRTLHIQLRAP